MPKRILLADDSITIQKVVELTFSDGDYEVVAVNNGAKAIQKLAEMRPDIILSDIIMPEKNGYEVCEYVKSHPEYRTIPVVLLTGTFEPFDPDRADKAGCDAVVTKPFESQSLIHKVDELIQQPESTAATTTTTPNPMPEPAALEPAPSPWADETPQPADESPFAGSAPGFAPAPGGDAFASGFQPHGSDIFGAAPSDIAESASDMPFETASSEAFSSETRAFSRMSFDDLQKMAEPQQPAPPTPPPAAPEPAASPFNEAAPAFGGETRAFPRMSFEDLEKMTEQAAPAAPPVAPPAPPPAPPVAESLPWEEQSPAFGGETRAFPSFSLDELQQPASPEPPPAIAEPESPFGEEPQAFSGETRAFTKMSFEDLQEMAPEPAPQAIPEPEPEPEPQRADSSLFEEPAAQSPFDEGAEEVPFAATSEAPVEPEISAPPMAAAAPPMAISAAPPSADLTDEQIERIARRVVQMLSADEVKKIAWEVIPDMAEMVVKERIRQLESEA
jgi:CheY-like chemotaxis protein